MSSEYNEEILWELAEKTMGRKFFEGLKEFDKLHDMLNDESDDQLFCKILQGYATKIFFGVTCDTIKVLNDEEVDILFEDIKNRFKLFRADRKENSSVH